MCFVWDLSWVQSSGLLNLAISVTTVLGLPLGVRRRRATYVLCAAACLIAKQPCFNEGSCTFRFEIVLILTCCCGRHRVALPRSPFADGDAEEGSVHTFFGKVTPYTPSLSGGGTLLMRHWTYRTSDASMNHHSNHSNHSKEAAISVSLVLLNILIGQMFFGQSEASYAKEAVNQKCSGRCESGARLSTWMCPHVQDRRCHVSPAVAAWSLRLPQSVRMSLRPPDSDFAASLDPDRGPSPSSAAAGALARAVSTLRPLAATMCATPALPHLLKHQGACHCHCCGCCISFAGMSWCFRIQLAF